MSGSNVFVCARRSGGAIFATAGPTRNVGCGIPTPAEDASGYDPEKEAERIGIKLYPGARILSMPYQIRNYYQQRLLFATTDSRDYVEKFYDQIYGVRT